MSSVAAQYLREFHELLGLHCADTPTMPDDTLLALRADLLTEEAGEYAEASAARDLVEMADALADVVYVAYGNALSLGIDLDAVLAEVHMSNMTKRGPDGTLVMRADGKVLKPPTFEPPQIARVLGLGDAP